MKRIALIQLFLGLIAGHVLGHGVPIDVTVQDGKLAPFRHLGKTTFDVSVLVENPLVGAIFGDVPGMSVANAANGVAIGTELGLDIASSLAFWDGAILATDASIEIFPPEGVDSYLVSASSSQQTGLLWGEYGGQRFWDADGLYFLRDTTPDPGMYGTMVQLTSPSYETSEPFLLSFVYDPFAVYDDATLEIAKDMLTASLTLPGDLNHDGVADAKDVDLLCRNIATQGADFDLNADGQYDLADLSVWLEDTGYGQGDADLSSKTDFADFLRLLDNFGSLGGAWTHGDFNCDGAVAFADFVVLSEYFGQTSAAESVPEPSSPMMVSIFVLGLVVLGRSRRRSHRTNCPRRSPIQQPITPLR